jgi:hypothetical protein
MLSFGAARRSYRRRSYLKMTSRTEEIGSASSTYRLMPYLPFRFRALRAASGCISLKAKAVAEGPDYWPLSPTAAEE